MADGAYSGSWRPDCAVTECPRLEGVLSTFTHERSRPRFQGIEKPVAGSHGCMATWRDHWSRSRYKPTFWRRGDLRSEGEITSTYQPPLWTARRTSQVRPRNALGAARFDAKPSPRFAHHAQELGRVVGWPCAWQRPGCRALSVFAALRNQHPSNRRKAWAHASMLPCYGHIAECSHDRE